MPEPGDHRVSWIDASGRAVRLLSSSTATTTRFVRKYDWKHAEASAPGNSKAPADADQDLDGTDRP